MATLGDVGHIFLVQRATSANGAFTLKIIEDIFWAIFVSRTFNVAIFALLLWDILLTFAQEVEVVWKSRWTVIKVLFLLNRYLTPFIMLTHIWTFSGYAQGLNDVVCRVIYSATSVVEVICISTVSAIISIRLFALYRTSVRVLCILLLYSALTIVAVAVLMVPNLWLRLDTLSYEPRLNICVMYHIPTTWTQWLPRVIEHAIFCLFLIINAMATPRSNQTVVLSIFYRDGIVYYALTLTFLLSTLLAFRFASPAYLGLIAFSTSVGLAMSTSHLLLNMKSSQRLDDTSNFVDLPGLRSNDDNIHYEEQVDQHLIISKVPGMSREDLYFIQPRNLDHGLIPKTSDKKELTMFWSAASFRQSAWWLFGGHVNNVILDAHVTICRDQDVESSAVQGVKMSRLGRYDYWL